MDYLVISLYKIVALEDPEAVVKEHKLFFSGRSMSGRIYVSQQGLNAQLSGLQADVAEYLQWLKRDPRFSDAVAKAQPHHENVFPRMTVKVRPELVAMGCELDLSNRGVHVSPRQWREMLESSEEYLKLDVRNQYEWEVGHFEGFECPTAETFRDFVHQAQQLKEQCDPRQVKVMMCCTGGIRCEFYSAFLRQHGFEQVYQLEGGILGYAAQEGASHWKGKLFVFDDRLAVDISGEEIVGRCHRCQAACDAYYNCADMDCNALFISCDACLQELAGCCQEQCRHSDRLRPFDHQRGGKPFRKWYTYFAEKHAVCPGA